jgi:hypothetical protein
MTYFSVGDVWFSEQNITKALLQNIPILLVATHKGCKSCCQHEAFYR